jgi:hypothetical protein
MRSATIRQTIAASLLLSTAAVAWAQSPAAPDQLDTTRQRQNLEQSGQLLYEQNETAPELYPHEADDVGPQSVLVARSPRTLFEGSADSQYYYTDNAFLDHTGGVSSGVLVSSAQFAIAPSPYKLGEGQSSPRIGFREQWYDFLEYQGQNPNLDNFDFNAQTAFAEERWTYKNWSFGGGFDYTRLLTTSNYRQFYSEYVPRWEASRLFRVGRHQSLSLSYLGYYHFTDASQITALSNPGFFDRLDQVLLATYSWEPAANVIFQPYYSLRYSHYTSTDRDDYLNSVGLGIYYFLGNYVSARAFVGYEQRYSNLAAAEYHQFNTGGGLNFTIKF